MEREQLYATRPGGIQEGPCTYALMETRYRMGKYPEGTLIRYQGADGWLPIEQVFGGQDTDLTDEQAQSTPPPPPPGYLTQATPPPPPAAWLEASPSDAGGQSTPPPPPPGYQTQATPPPPPAAWLEASPPDAGALSTPPPPPAAGEHTQVTPPPPINRLATYKRGCLFFGVVCAVLFLLITFVTKGFDLSREEIKRVGRAIIFLLIFVASYGFGSSKKE